MKNVFRLIGFMTLVAVIGFSFAACNKAASAGNKVAVTGVTLSNTELYLAVGGSVTLTASVTPADATNKSVVWATGDASVVTVNNGTITAVGVGTTAIAVATEDGEKIATCAVYVTSTTPTPTPTPTTTSGGRDSRLVNPANEGWVDSYPVGNRDGFVFKADGTCYVINDYTGTTPGVWNIHGAPISWTTSGNNLIISFGSDIVTYSYTVTATTFTITLNGVTDIYTKAAVMISGI
jgi:predicted small secreted protein